MIIDGHLHLFRAVSDEYPRGVYEEIAPAGREERAERLLEHMATAGSTKPSSCPCRLTTTTFETSSATSPADSPALGYSTRAWPTRSPT